MNLLTTSSTKPAWQRQQLRSVEVRLRQATMLVSEGEQFIGYQRAVISALEGAGRDVTSAKVILNALDRAQERHIERYSQLIAELARLSSLPPYLATLP